MKQTFPSNNNMARFAIYFCPKIETQFHALGSRWMGRDSRSEKAIKQPVIPNISPKRFYHLTRNPRLYGFHGTLKAPFRLNNDFSPIDLRHCIQKISAQIKPFTISLKVDQIGGFFALVTERNGQKIRALASLLVEELDKFRAPLNETEIKKRRLSNLTLAQDDNLLNWGYPYVFLDFHFHMTLTEKITCETEKNAIKAAAALHFSNNLQNLENVNDISLFFQKNPATPFFQIHRFRLGK